MIGQHVLVRTHSAGVHIGTLAEHDGKMVRLTDCRRIWRWYGALELYAVARFGIDSEKSTLSVAAPEIILTEAIEIHPTSEEARATFSAAEAKRERA
jgi:hypothetical protein